MDGDEAWLAAEREQAGTCPACGAADARPIFYGMPEPGLYMRLSDRVAFYGCCLPAVLHRWTCGRCGQEWGDRPSFDEPEDLEVL